MRQNFFLTAAVTIAAVLLALIIYTFLRPVVSGLSAQEALWAFYRWAGWWWWGISIALSLLGLVYLLTLSAPSKMPGKLVRTGLIIGFTLHLASWGNNALGPLANLLILASAVGMVCMISRSHRNVRRLRRRPANGATQKLYRFLSDEEIVGN